MGQSMTDFLNAECAIRQLHGRYMDAVWRQDSACFADCFASDGRWKIAGLDMRGRDEIRDGCGRLLGLCEKIQLVTLPAVLEVGDKKASGRVHMIEFAKMLDGGAAMTIGVYHDRYVEEEERWRYASRHWSFKYRGPPDLGAAFVDTPDYGPFPGMPEADEPTYARKR
jgi:uncharacterized protein (TIGR02246 family)